MFLRRVLSLLWSGWNEFREFVDLRVLRCEPVQLGQARVIGVGNFEAGGTGKTPLVIEIARQALSRGKSVAILMRGYRAAREHTGGVIVPARGGNTLDPAEWGDEVALAHRACPEAWIGVGADRVASFERVVSARGGKDPDVVVIEDASTQWKMIQNIKLWLVTEHSPGARWLKRFPKQGPRDVIILNKGSSAPFGLLPRFKLQWQTALNADNEKTLKLWIVSGLGSPEQLESALSAAGLQWEQHIRVRDHYAWKRAEVLGWIARAQEAGARLVLTSKDSVKWESLVPERRLAWSELTLHLSPSQDVEALWSLLFG